MKYLYTIRSIVSIGLFSVVMQSMVFSMTEIEMSVYFSLENNTPTFLMMWSGKNNPDTLVKNGNTWSDIHFYDRTGKKQNDTISNFLYIDENIIPLASTKPTSSFSGYIYKERGQKANFNVFNPIAFDEYYNNPMQKYYSDLNWYYTNKQGKTYDYGWYRIKAFMIMNKGQASGLYRSIYRSSGDKDYRNPKSVSTDFSFAPVDNQFLAVVDWLEVFDGYGRIVYDKALIHQETVFSRRYWNGRKNDFRNRSSIASEQYNTLHIVNDAGVYKYHELFIIRNESSQPIYISTEPKHTIVKGLSHYDNNRYDTYKERGKVDNPRHRKYMLTHGKNLHTEEKKTIINPFAWLLRSEISMGEDGEVMNIGYLEYGKHNKWQLLQGIEGWSVVLNYDDEVFVKNSDAYKFKAMLNKFDIYIEKGKAKVNIDDLKDSNFSRNKRQPFIVYVTITDEDIK